MSDIETKKKLISSRKDLLDIGLRNNMINFRAGAKSLAVIDELSEEVLKILYIQGKSMSFSSMPEKKLKEIAKIKGYDESLYEAHDDSTIELLQELDQINWDDSNDETDQNGKSTRHTDNKLQTALNGERLFLSLLKIHTEAQTYIEEQGVNILFLALGFLHWYESDSSEKLRKAPLVLLPVELKRSGSKDTFQLNYTDDDVIQNLSLAAKLKTDFSIDLPLYALDSGQDIDELFLAKFYDQVKDSIKNQNRWKIVPNEIHLGFFSFGKFLMFNDLDSTIWPDEKQPSDHPVLSKLLNDGFVNENPTIEENAHLDLVISPGEINFVRDADSSQTIAILEARAGRNLVIQGPPGTGKSQTITNVIAEFLGQGKTVLFVAEKMAALEVVKRRLDENHLGDAVLELHSHKATKQSVLKELGRTLDQGKPITQDGSEDIEALKRIRDELNNYCDAVNTPLEPSGISFIHSLGKYLELKRKFPNLDIWNFEPFKDWTYQKYKSSREKIIELTSHLNEMGNPSKNPFWGSKKLSFSPIEQNTLFEALKKISDLLSQIKFDSSKLADHLNLKHPSTLSEVEIICRAALRATEAPKLDGVKINTHLWQSNRDAIRELIDAGKNMQENQVACDAILIEQAWDQDLLLERQHFINYGDKWWKFLSGKYRYAKARLQGLCKNVLPIENSACIKLIDNILTYQKYKKIYDTNATLGQELFGAQWNRQKSDWQVLNYLSEWIFTLYDDLGNRQLPQGLIEFLAGKPDSKYLKELVDPLQEKNKICNDVFKGILASLEYDSHVQLLLESIETLQAKVQIWINSLATLYQLARYNNLRAEMIDHGLSSTIAYTDNWEQIPDNLLRSFDLSWYAGVVETAYSKFPALSQFDRIKQANLLDQFRSLDHTSIEHAQTKLARSIWERTPNINHPGEMGILRNELNKKRRLMPIRQLIAQAGRAIQQIKPVFMMSPMSIANFLPPGKIEFDVVIFDEASQVKAVDAFGAILRGQQVVVVGDTRQMPPTDFFGREIETDDEDNVTSDIESILSMFRAKGALERYLSWHYRSRHESLIAVSNVEFYDRRLVIFPSPGTNENASGLKFRHLPHAIYDRGRTRTNREEAKAVAKAVIEHAEKRPNLSLGVVAFSMAQRDLIQVEVELMRRDRNDLSDFFNEKHPTEPFFVKNLENVQGDERDVIFISIGYGRNESGRIAKEFGPVNREGGERRLNVLISRAKMAMEVFCNFTADELELDAYASHGVRALKHFLKYAETGNLDIPKETGKQVDSPFESEVIEALRERGYQIEPQVGTAGYFIDIAVKDPDFPGRYILAIECDGASYHSSRSARDRDRLRQGVLESLGWRFHRIWSTDWFRNSSEELERAVIAIENARKSNLSPSGVLDKLQKNNKSNEILREVNVEENLSSFSKNYVQATLPISSSSKQLHQESLPRLVNLIKTVVEVEAPVHEQLVIKRIMESYGVSRAGNRITENIKSAIKYGNKNSYFSYSDEFLYKDKSCEIIEIRNRSNLAVTDKKIEYVAPEEIDRTILDVIKMSFSIDKESAISEALNILGFGRATNNISSIMHDRLDILLKSQQVVLFENKLMVRN